jgi:hypothetical protein
MMMDDKRIQRLVGKMALDDDFRSMMLRDPLKAANSIGVFLSSDQAAVFRALDPKEVDDLASMFKGIMPPVTMDW